MHMYLVFEWNEMLLCTVRTLWCLNITPISDPTPICTELSVPYTDVCFPHSWVLVVGVFHSFRSVIMSPSSRDLDTLSHWEEENTFTIIPTTILVISFTILRKVLPFYRNWFSGGFRWFSHCSWKWVMCTFLTFSLFTCIDLFKFWYIFFNAFIML